MSNIKRNANEMALSIGFFMFCMGNTFKIKKWCLQKPGRKFHANTPRNTTFEGNQGQTFAWFGSKSRGIL